MSSHSLPEQLSDLSPALRVIAGGDPLALVLLGGSDASADAVLARYAVVPSLGNPRVLLPLDAGTAALATALAQYAGGASSPLFRAAALGLRAAGRVGLARPLLRHRFAVASAGGDLRDTPLHDFLSRVLGRRDFVTSLRIAPRRPNGKPVVQAIAGDGTLAAYAKFGWEAMTRRLIRHEAKVLSELSPLARGTTLRMPRILFAGEWQGLEVLVTAPLDGRRLRIATPSEIPIGPTRALAALRGQGCVRLGETAFWQQLAARTDGAAPMLGVRRGMVLAARQEVEERWGDVELPLGQCHGDWIPPNMSQAGDGAFNVWDWELSEDSVPLGIDTMHFVLYMELRRRQSLRSLVYRVRRFSQAALARQGLDPATEPLLLMLHLLRMIDLYGQARSAGQSKDGDLRYLRVLQAVIR
jgi:hypothetical protein